MVASFFAVAILVFFDSGQQQNPFEPPRAKYTVAPERTFDLLNLDVVLDVDYAKRRFAGHTVNTLLPLRSGQRAITLHAGKKLEVSGVTVNGTLATFERKEENLNVAVPATTRGKSMKVVVRFSSEKQLAGGFGSEGGWHWIEPEPGVPGREGCWTQGQTNYNRNWAPTWDYPNDFATTSTTVTVPAHWTVIGNGVKTADKVGGNRRTVAWKMAQPHATYLLSLCCGPFDVKTAKWQDVELLYVAPKGKGALLEDSFGDTPDMLSFFSSRFGVKYPWPKYAQNAMYDFGGGMENVTATTLGHGNLTDARSGFREMAGLNAHELGHQWFGDLVTCRDWGNTWLNESFATFCETVYMEHSRGPHAYAREVENNRNGYFFEANRYVRPLTTRWYPDDDSMFDSHSYPKGSSVIHTMRRMLGDEAFFAGVKLYLTRHRHQPVEASDLCQALTEASGVNMEPFFDQWVFKPGHPVIEYSWSYDDAAKKVTLEVKQTQNTAKGIPIYTIPTKVGMVLGNRFVRQAVTLEGAAQTISVPAATKPSAVILDPDHDFLRQMRHEFAPEEVLSIYRFAPNAVDRQRAFNAVFQNKPNADVVASIADLLRKDSSMFPVIENTGAMSSNMKSKELQPFWISELAHANNERARSAVRWLADNGDKTTVMPLLKAKLNSRESYDEVIAVIRALDSAADWATLEQASQIPSWRNRVRDEALKRMAEGNPAKTKPHILKAARLVAKNSVEFEGSGSIELLSALPYDSDVKAAMMEIVKARQQRAILGLLAAITRSKDKAFVPELQKHVNDPQFSTQAKNRMKSTIEELAKA